MGLAAAKAGGAHALQKVCGVLYAANERDDAVLRLEAQNGGLPGEARGYLWLSIWGRYLRRHLLMWALLREAPPPPPHVHNNGAYRVPNVLRAGGVSL